jgi:flagellar hook-length control protein FliK
MNNGQMNAVSMLSVMQNVTQGTPSSDAVAQDAVPQNESTFAGMLNGIQRQAQPKEVPTAAQSEQLSVEIDSAQPAAASVVVIAGLAATLLAQLNGPQLGTIAAEPLVTAGNCEKTAGEGNPVSTASDIAMQMAMAAYLPSGRMPEVNVVAELPVTPLQNEAPVPEQLVATPAVSLQSGTEPSTEFLTEAVQNIFVNTTTKANSKDHGEKQTSPLADSVVRRSQSEVRAMTQPEADAAQVKTVGIGDSLQSIAQPAEDVAVMAAPQIQQPVVATVVNGMTPYARTVDTTETATIPATALSLTHPATERKSYSTVESQPVRLTEPVSIQPHEIASTPLAHTPETPLAQAVQQTETVPSAPRLAVLEVPEQPAEQPAVVPLTQHVDKRQNVATPTVDYRGGPAVQAVPATTGAVEHTAVQQPIAVIASAEMVTEIARPVEKGVSARDIPQMEPVLHALNKGLESAPPQNVHGESGTESAPTVVAPSQSVPVLQKESGRTPTTSVSMVPAGSSIIQNVPSEEGAEVAAKKTAEVMSGKSSAVPPQLIQQNMRSAAGRVSTTPVAESTPLKDQITPVKELTALAQKTVTAIETSLNSEESLNQDGNQSGSNQMAARHGIQPLPVEPAKSVRPVVDIPTGAAAETARLATTEQIANQVRDRLAQHELKPGNQQITLTLSPDSLGELKMSLNLQGQKLSVEIITENRMVRDAVIQHTDALKESLARQNITMESFDVTTGGKGSAGQGQNQNAWRELAKQQQQQQFWNSPRGYATAQADLPAGHTAYQQQQGRSMLDIHY